MYAYCQNSPIVFMDSNGYCREVGALLTWIDCENKHCPTSSKYLHGTLTVGIGASVTAFVGVSDSLAFSFDLHGNVEVQRSTSRPDKPETTTIGLISYSVPAYFVQLTNKGDISELTGISTYVGADLPFCGFDVVSDAPAADLNGKICGVQFAVGQGGGVDVHIAQTNTETIARFNWRDIGKWAKNYFV